MMLVFTRLLIVCSFCLLVFACSNQSSTPPLHVPEGYRIELVAGPDLVDYPMFATLDETGRLFVFESIGNVYETSEQAVEDPRFRIKLLEDLNGDGKYDKATVFADHLSFPQGGVFIDGSLIASSAPDLLKLTDTDGDNVADKREVLLSGFTLNVNANSLIGPFLGPDGWLYMTSAIEGFDVNTQEGEQLRGETARIWRVRPDGSQLEWIAAGGMNNPVELTFSPAGEAIGTQTFYVDPQRGLRDAITYWAEGGIYGKKNSNIDRDGLPRTGGLLPVVSEYSRVAPVGIEWYTGNSLGMDFNNNLFSTQFNTHQVIRHRIARQGASFKMEDQVFLWTDNEDFHPTDVLEDADGSLLIVETGGWFILGCPLSQVSKSQLKGAIYRVTGPDRSGVKDPYGNDVSWPSLSNGALGEYLEKGNRLVSGRAQKELIKRGESSVDLFEQILVSSGSEAARIKAVYGLYQLNSQASVERIITAFKDQSVEVRVAAAKAAGLSGSKSLGEGLSQLLLDQHPAVVRQAATALGQIGAPEYLDKLIQAVDHSEDRFVEHALRYSLLQMGNPEPLMARLKTSSNQQIATILVVLDQIAGFSLDPQLVMTYLDHPVLNPTALGIATNHPEWAPVMIQYLNDHLIPAELDEEEMNRFRDLINSYCGTGEMELFLSQMLGKTDRQMIILALTSMAQCQVDPFPEAWQEQISGLLMTSSDPGILMQTVDLVRQRGLPGMSPELNEIAGNPEKPMSLRVAALGASLPETGTLEESQFSLLCQVLIEKNAPIVTHDAAYVLSTAELTSQQFTYLVDQVMPQLDPFLIPRLLPAFEKSNDLLVGKQLVEQLIDLPSLDNFSESYISQLFVNYPDGIEGDVHRLIDKLRTAHRERIQKISSLEQVIAQGDEGRGRALFFGKATCSTCHTTSEGGGNMGPDLTSIQKDRSVHDIIEAIVYPSVSFVREYETYQITTGQGDFRGVIKERTPDMILLETAPGITIRINSEDLVSIEQLEVSMMPQGLDQLLTEDEFSDLMAFLLGKDLEY